MELQQLEKSGYNEEPDSLLRLLKTELLAYCRMEQLLPLQQHQNHSTLWLQGPSKLDFIQLLLDRAFFVSNTTDI